MDTISQLVEGLRDKNNKAAYQCLKDLEVESKKTDIVYQYMDTFIEMLDDPNSYIRARGIILIAANAKWDNDNKIDEIIDKFLEHIMDEKPITSRQCIKLLPSIAKYKIDLIDIICSALRKADPDIYADSMQPLVYKDIREALDEIEKIKK